jgi:hypothetical protein
LHLKGQPTGKAYDRQAAFSEHSIDKNDKNQETMLSNIFLKYIDD